MTRRPVTVTANSCQKTFGTADPEFTAKVEGTLGNDTVDYKLSREKGEDVGTYTITSTGDEKQGNYKVTYNPGTLTIVAAQRTTELSVTSYNGVYDAKKHTIAVNGTVDGD
ncbi:MAG: MBG domain-containing protein, partial [Lachnospiraceae bacterium]|nr:MBG domain-containing protein [Lachnospiraceae bacterium]